jgi:hypothetical protein
MKALIAVLAVAIAPAHFRFDILGIPVSIPALVLILAAEGLAAAAVTWLAVRAIRRFRSTPWPRFNGAMP